jgi:hypothetical protein
MFAGLKYTALPNHLRDEGPHYVGKVWNLIVEKNWSLVHSDIKRIGYDKRYGITITWRLNPKYGCLVCENKHETIIFRVSIKTQRVSMFCWKERKSEKVNIDYYYDSGDDAEQKMKTPKSVNVFIHFVLLFRYRYRISEKAKTCEDAEKKAYLISLLEKDALFGDKLLDSLPSEEKKTVNSIKKLTKEPLVSAHVLFRAYKMWFCARFPKSHIRFNLAKFTMYLSQFLCKVKTESILAPVVAAFNLDESVLPIEVVSADMSEKIKSILQ